MRPPNLVFLYTDEQRFDTLAAYGNHAIQMPNLNRFAEQATVFERTYVTQPVCTPSRASLLTGLYPHTNGCVANNIPLRATVPCLPELLPAGQYKCAHLGKWHLGDEIYPQHGFRTWLGTEDTYHRYYSGAHEELADRSAYHHWLLAHGVHPKDHGAEARTKPYLKDRFFRDQISASPEPVSRPAFLSESARRYIREHAAEPFVMYVNFLEPHMPFHSCRDRQYDPAAVTLPGNAGQRPTPDHSLAARLKAARYAALGFEEQRLETEAHWRQLTASYWGLCSLVDTHVGKILATLTECGLDDHTLVVFTSDHGDMMSSHGLLGKDVMYEEATRVPFLVRLPGQREGRRVTNPVSHIDVVPTLLDLLGQRPPDRLQGKSLRPLLEGQAGREAEDVFIEWNVGPREPDTRKVTLPPPLPQYAAGMCTPEQAYIAGRAVIRTVVTADHWKFNWSSLEEHELFDLNADPLELTNLAKQPAHRARMTELAARICRWQERTGDQVKLPPVTS